MVKINKTWIQKNKVLKICFSRDLLWLYNLFLFWIKINIHHGFIESEIPGAKTDFITE